MTLHRLATGILSFGHSLQLVRPQQGNEAASIASDTFETVLVQGVSMPGYQGLRFGFPAHRLLTRLWENSPPDFLHIATEGPLGWSALRVARKLQIPVVSSFHTNFHSYGKHYGLGLLEPLASSYLSWFHNQTAATFAPTRAICDELMMQGMRRLQVMSRGVDTDLYSPLKRCQQLRAEWKVADEAPVVLYVGRLATEKNLDLAIHAFRRVQALSPESRFVLVGDGPMRAQLMAQHPDFIFTGFKTGQALATCYASADLFVFPSATETFGNVLTEAMASGLPCVAYDYAAAKEYATSGENALLVPLQAEARFIAAAEALVQDSPMRQRIGAAARALTLDLNWSSVVQKYLEDVYKITQEQSEPIVPCAAPVI